MIHQNDATAPPIFIGGAGRSGTTLLRVILDSHPHIACGPELKITPYIAQMWFELGNTFENTLRQYHMTPEEVDGLFCHILLSCLDKYRRSSGKKRSAEKSPSNVFFFGHLASMFPDSPLIHMIRDGRDVVCSLLTMDWPDPATGKPFDYTRNVRKAAQYWVSAVTVGRQARKDPLVAPNYMELRYEALVHDPEPTLKHLFQFIKEPWDSVVLAYHRQQRNLAGESSAHQVTKPLYQTAIGRWHRDLKGADKDIVKNVAGDLLIELGYAQDLEW